MLLHERREGFHLGVHRLRTGAGDSRRRRLFFAVVVGVVRLGLVDGRLLLERPRGHAFVRVSKRGEGVRAPDHARVHVRVERDEHPTNQRDDADQHEKFLGDGVDANDAHLGRNVRVQRRDVRLHHVHARVEQDVAHREREVWLGADNLQAKLLRLVERLVAAARGERQRQPRQSQSRRVPQNLRLPEINNGERLAVWRDEEVSRVRIAVEFTQGEYLHPESLDEFADERAAVHRRAVGSFHFLCRLFREIRRGAHPRGADRTLDDVGE